MSTGPLERRQPEISRCLAARGMKGMARREAQAYGSHPKMRGRLTARHRGVSNAGPRFSVCRSALAPKTSVRQRYCCSREAGGQLFGKVSPGAWTVVLATGPRPSDRRTKWSFQPDRSAERHEIRRLFEKGLHYLGDWHTHPQGRPRPSQTDLKSMKEMIAKSHYELEGFLMVIVGTSRPPEGLWVSLHTPSRPAKRLTVSDSANLLAGAS